MQHREPTQLEKVYHLMRDGHWRTLPEIRRYCGGMETALSARLRDFRKPAFGGYRVDCRVRGRKGSHLFEYRLEPKPITAVDDMLREHPMLGDIEPYMTGAEPRKAPEKRI